MIRSLVVTTKPQPTIAYVTLNDPDSRNAMSEAMAEAFVKEISQVRFDRNIRVVVLTGAGKAFSGGGHLEMLFEKTKLSLEKNQQLMETFYDHFLSIRDLDVPVIAAINGHAVGAGLCLALACDIRVAVKEAKLGLNFAQLGLHPGMGATYFLPRLVGPAHAAELLYTGKIISAELGVQIGLINQVVEADLFRTNVEDLVASIAQAGPHAVREVKKSLQLSPFLSLQEALHREAECQAADYIDFEFLEGITAAREKRKPEFN